MPRTSVVFPAPSSPDSVSTMPLRAPVARSAPACTVAAASGRRRCRSPIIALSMVQAPPPRHRHRLMPSGAQTDLDQLARDIPAWGRELGFAEIGISDTDLSAEEAHLLSWLDQGRHGEMHYMA